MKLRTNYHKQDWYKFILTNLMVFCASGSIVVLGTNYLLLPGMDMLSVVTHKMAANDSELATKAGNYIRSHLEAKYGAEHLVTSMLVIFFGCFVGVLVLWVSIIQWAGNAAWWVCKKLDLTPSMALVVIRNEKFWFRVRI